MSFDDALYESLKELFGSAAKKPPYSPEMIVPVATIRKALERLK